jgi:hypothetical protein
LTSIRPAFDQRFAAFGRFRPALDRRLTGVRPIRRLGPPPAPNAAPAAAVSGDFWRFENRKRKKNHRSSMQSAADCVQRARIRGVVGGRPTARHPVTNAGAAASRGHGASPASHRRRRPAAAGGPPNLADTSLDNSIHASTRPSGVRRAAKPGGYFTR